MLDEADSELVPAGFSLGPVPPTKLPEVVKLRLERSKAKTKEWRKQRRAWRKKYRKYLLSPAWKIRRQKRLDKAGGICEYCKKNAAVHVHHVNYKRVFKEHQRDLRAICLACHKLKHPGKRFRKLRRKVENTGCHEVEF